MNNVSTRDIYDKVNITQIRQAINTLDPAVKPWKLPPTERKAVEILRQVMADARPTNG